VVWTPSKISSPFLNVGCSDDLTMSPPTKFGADQSTRFYCAAYTQRSLSDRKGVCASVRLSVCLSITRVNCDKTNKSSAEILILYERKSHVVFQTHRMVGGVAPFYLKFWVKLTHPASKTAIFTQYSLVAAQPLELAKKVQL